MKCQSCGREVQFHARPLPSRLQRVRGERQVNVRNGCEADISGLSLRAGSSRPASASSACEYANGLPRGLPRPRLRRVCYGWKADTNLRGPLLRVRPLGMSAVSFGFSIAIVFSISIISMRFRILRAFWNASQRPAAKRRWSIVIMLYRSAGDTTDQPPPGALDFVG